MKKQNIKTVSIVFVTIVLIGLLLSQIKIIDIVNTLRSIEPANIAIGLLLYALSYYFRALRFYLLLDKKIKLKDMFYVVSVHNMANNIIPARAGELSYIYLLKKLHSKTTGEGFATLIIARLLDFVALTSFFFVSVLFVKNLPVLVMNTLWLVGFFMIFIVVFLLSIIYYGKKSLIFTKKILNKLGLVDRKIFVFLLKKMEEAVQSIDSIRNGNNIYQIIISTFLLWGLNYFIVYFLLSSMNISLPLQNVVLGATFCLLTTVLPIHGVGGFGTNEGVWTLVFVPLGMPLETAIVSGFSYHIITVFYYILIGIYGSVVIHIKSKQLK
jgi:hypothetical protein